MSKSKKELEKQNIETDNWLFYELAKMIDPNKTCPSWIIDKILNIKDYTSSDSFIKKIMKIIKLMEKARMPIFSAKVFYWSMQWS